jgi:hypothetical protein
MARRGKWYLDGFQNGNDAAEVNVKESPDEILRALHEDRLGEIAGDIRDHQSQMAGDIVYDVDRRGGPTMSQFEKWEEGFFDGFAATVAEWAKKAPVTLFNGARAR